MSRRGRMKHLTATFEIENDLQEYNLRQVLKGMNVKYVKTLADTEHLKDNPAYKKFIKQKKDAQLEIDRFINKNRL